MRLRIELVCEAPGMRTSAEIEHALYRVVQEALINIHKHAAATSAVVHYFREPGLLVLEIEDDGVGMEVGVGSAMGSGVGIPGMQARMSQLGGSLNLSSAGRGVLVRAEVPVVEAEWGFQPRDEYLLPIIQWKEGLP
jgi:signal transduction histidine kinase